MADTVFKVFYSLRNVDKVICGPSVIFEVLRSLVIKPATPAPPLALVEVTTTTPINSKPANKMNFAENFSSGQQQLAVNSAKCGAHVQIWSIYKNLREALMMS